MEELKLTSLSDLNLKEIKAGADYADCDCSCDCRKCTDNSIDLASETSMVDYVSIWEIVKSGSTHQEPTPIPPELN